jgi:hypothetical protein
VCLGFGFGLGEDAAASGYHRISGKDNAARMARGDSFSLFGRHAPGIEVRHFGLRRRFIYVSRINPVRHDTKPRKQFHASRACGGKDDGGHIRHAELDSASIDTVPIQYIVILTLKQAQGDAVGVI